MSLAAAISRRPGKKRRILRILLWLAGFVLLALALLIYLLYAPAPREPELSARPVPQTLRVGPLERSYLLYLPARRAPAAPLLLVFHGRMGSPGRIRVETGYQFDRLADRHGFVVAYPQGYEGSWNGCRAAADSQARRLGVDDIAFVEALVARLAQDQGVDPARVFVAGLSNGGHFVYRLALERPELIAGAAVFAAGLPTPENLDCTPRGTPPPVLIVNGTSDPINPYGGGKSSLFGFVDLGTVRSGFDSARYFAGAGGAAAPAVTRVSPTHQSDQTWVERAAWRIPGRSEVVLLTVHCGGHVVPQPAYRPPRLLGRATTAINGPDEAWSFFRRQPSRDVNSS